MNRIFNPKMIAAGLLALSMALTGCMTSDNGPSISTQPTSLFVALNGTATFTVAASGSGLSYQWTKNGSNLTNNVYVSGATTATLTLSGLVYSDSGAYACVVTNSSGSATSNAAVLQVGTPYAEATTLTVGAQGNTTLATAMDLSVPDTLFSASANKNPSYIDLLFVYYNSGFFLMSPAEAKYDQITVANNYPSTVADDMMVKVSSKPVSQEAAAAAFNAGSKADYQAVSGGEMFVVKTNLDTYAFLQVNSVSTASNTGSGVLSVSVGTWGATN